MNNEEIIKEVQKTANAVHNKDGLEFWSFDILDLKKALSLKDKESQEKVEKLKKEIKRGVASMRSINKIFGEVKK